MTNIKRLCLRLNQIPISPEAAHGEHGSHQEKDTSEKHGLTCKGGGEVDLVSLRPEVREQWR